ncbi:hypothetical protein HFU84_02370 [Acidithiobacillus sp. CV18-2]|nr:hypothetical protein [Acidithiobacillus sp. CV18-3]MBU2757170.1 hypothetical protein [Acidithiobacillus sp. BN09-2]MBU2776375.1 hypothetical protein [Acidithiobacillus sp. CV18-2]MBU2798983.1 hypothetical protein [Acidithiobacillus sp. VAN18-4]
MTPQSAVLEDIRPEEWYSRDEDRDREYKSGIRFCTLYRQKVRSRREEAELGTAYWVAYQAAYATAAQIAQKAGLRDSELIADCAAGLVDFGARQYDETAVGKGGRPKTFADFLKNIAYAYLRKHRDFLSFARKMTGTGYASQDLMTVATFGDEYARMKRESAAADDYRDVFDTLDPDAVESLYAAEWSGFATDDDDEVGQSLNEIEDHLPATLREWIDYLLQQIQHSGMSPATLAMRVPAILEQLKSATGARVMDIVKRLIARTKTGCLVALEMLRGIRTAIPERHEQTLKLIEEVLDSVRIVPQMRTPSLTSQQLSVSWQEHWTLLAVPYLQQVSQTVTGLPCPDIPESGAIQPLAVETIKDLEALDVTAESGTQAKDTQPAGTDNDLAFLIDPSDLRHGRVPPAKPRYITVDAPPVEPSGAPPLLEETPTTAEMGPPGTQIVSLLQRLRARKNVPRKKRMVPATAIPPGIRSSTVWQSARAM